MGVDPTCFSGHSFQIGAATTAAQAGVEDAMIKMLVGIGCLPMLYSHSKGLTS